MGTIIGIVNDFYNYTFSLLVVPPKEMLKMNDKEYEDFLEKRIDFVLTLNKFPSPIIPTHLDRDNTFYYISDRYINIINNRFRNVLFYQLNQAADVCWLPRF